MHTGDKLIVIFIASAACCFVLPFAPASIQAWARYGPGAWLIPAAIVAGIAWTIWGNR